MTGNGAGRGLRTDTRATHLSASTATIVPRRGRSHWPASLAAHLVAGAAFLALLVIRPGGRDTVVAVSDLLVAAAAVWAAAACALVARRSVGWMRAFWWLLAAASASWACGELIWTWYEVALDRPVPYPSWADVGYLGGTPLAVAAFACHPAAHTGRRRRVLSVFDAVAVASAVLFVSWVLVLDPLWDESGNRSLGDLVAIAYPFGDVVILVLVVLALRGLPAGNRTSTLLLLGGLLVMAVTDTAYTYLAQVDAYASGDLIDSGWFIAYLAIAVGALAPGASGTQAPPVMEPSPVLSVLAPYVPILIALGVIAVEVPRGTEMDRIEWCIAVCLTVVVVGRQLLYLAQRRLPTRPAARPAGRPARRPTPAARPAVAGDPMDTRAELLALTAQIVAAGRPTAQERVRRASTTLVMGLTSVAGALAVWDLSLLVRGAG